MVNLLALAVLGFFLGMRHATDPDHVIAVTTIVARERSAARAAWIGVLWGIGHTVTILVVGGAIILFGLVIPARVGLAMELSVGLMLVLLGAMNLLAVTRGIAGGAIPPEAIEEGAHHAHSHRHGDYVHSHVHGHGVERHGHSEEATPTGRLDRVFGRLGPYQTLRPIVVGIVHGLAGSAAVALLVLATIRDPFWALAYLLVFGVGTIAGMMLITAAISVPFSYTAGRLAGMNRYLALASGLVSLAFGIFLVYRIGFVDGLFTALPRWTPR